MRARLLTQFVVFFAALVGLNALAAQRYRFSNGASVQFLDSGVFYRPAGRRGPTSDRLLAQGAASFLWFHSGNRKGDSLTFFVDNGGHVHALVEDGREMILNNPRFSPHEIEHPSFDGTFEEFLHYGRTMAIFSFRHGDANPYEETFLFSPEHGAARLFKNYWDEEGQPIRSISQNTLQVGEQCFDLSLVFGSYYSADPELQVGEGGRDLSLRTPSGEDIRLFSGPIRDLQTSPVPFGQRKHWLAIWHSGETTNALIVREDGVSARLASGFLRPRGTPTFQLEDGIFTVPWAPRSIDLARLEVEARFVPGSPMVVFGEDGDRVDPFQLTRQFFPDLMSQVRQQPNSAFRDADRDVLEGVLTALLQRNTGNVAILGPSGTGKTETVRTFLRLILEGDISVLQRTLRVLVVSPGSLNQGAGVVGVLETRIQALLETCRQVPTILFIDEFHSLRGIGTHSANSNDVIEYLKTALAQGTMRIIATSTQDEFLDAYGGDAAVIRRFVQVTQGEPSRETLLRQIRSWIERNGRPLLSEELQRYAAELASRYNATGAEPGRTISFVDNLYAALEARGRLRVPSRADLEQTAIRLYGVNPAFFDPNQLQRILERLPAYLDENIIGLENYKRALVSLTRIFYSNNHDARRPAIRVLAAGPPGTGKTELARVYAEAMGLPFERIEMNQYAFGDPSLFLAQVARSLRKNAFTVILFDEIEKASLEVQNVLLALLDHGIFNVLERSGSSGQNRRSVRVNARNATLIAATNAGTEFLVGRSSQGMNIFGANGTASVDAKDFRSALVADGLSEVFLDRCQYVVEAPSASPEQFRRIVALHLEKLVSDLSQVHGIPVAIENREAFLNHIVEKYYYDGISNRVAQNDIMLKHVRSVLADFRLERGSNPTTSITLRFEMSCPELFVAVEA